METVDQLPPPPLAPGLPLFGNALSMMGDVQGFLVTTYLREGAIFRIRALNQKFTVLAGAEANRLLLDRGEELFCSVASMGGLDREFDMRVHVLRGRPHRHLRSLLSTGLSRSLLAARWPQFTAVTSRALADWQTRPTLAVVDRFQRLAAAQLSVTLTGESSAAHFETLRYAFELMLDVTLAGKWPPMALLRPRYRRARARIRDFARESLAHRATRPPVETPDLLDLALRAVDENGDPYPPDVRAGIALQGYFAGINTVAYLYSFMLYALLRHPEVLTRVTAEVDRAYDNAPPDSPELPFEAIRDLPALRGVVLETLRLYSPAPASMRTVLTPFAFQGHRVDAGTRVLVATSVPHHLAEHYPDPRRFDIDRDFMAN